jgi:hypothetical protein
LDEKTACQEATETEPDPGMMHSIEEHQEIPKDDAAVMPVGEPRKLCRVQSLATDCQQKQKERTQGNSGSRRKLAAACRKVFRRAKVAWRKRNLVRKIRTQGDCGPRKELAIARRKITHHAEEARCKEHNRKRYDHDNVAPGTPEGWTSGIRRSKGPECNNCIMD